MSSSAGGAAYLESDVIGCSSTEWRQGPLLSMQDAASLGGLQEDGMSSICVLFIQKCCEFPIDQGAFALEVILGKHRAGVAATITA